MKKYIVLVMGCICLLVLNGCANSSSPLTKHWSHVVQEMGGGKTILDIDHTHAFGPAGINLRIMQFKLSDAGARQLRSEGVQFLENLSSVRNFTRNPLLSKMYMWYRETKPFDTWNETPMLGGNGQQLTIEHLLDADRPSAQEALRELPAEVYTQLKEIISTSGAYYSYGGAWGRDLLIVSPDHKMIFRIYKG